VSSESSGVACLAILMSEAWSWAGKNLLLRSTRSGRKHGPSLSGNKGEWSTHFPLKTKLCGSQGVDRCSCGIYSKLRFGKTILLLHHSLYCIKKTRYVVLLFNLSSNRELKLQNACPGPQFRDNQSGTPMGWRE